MRDHTVCFLTSARRHDDTRIYRREAVCLHKAGYDVTIICPDCQTTDSQGIRFRIAEIPQGSHLKKLFAAPFRVLGRAIDENASVYHFHDPELILTGLFLKMFGKKVFYDVHEDTPRVILTKEWIPALLRPFLSLVFEGVERLFSLAFDGIIASSQQIGARFPQKKTVVVGNYPDVSEFPSVIPDFENRDLAACMIGTIQEDRGILEVLECTRYLKYPVYLTGAYANEQIQVQVETQDEDHKLEYQGFLDWEGVVSVLLKSRAGLAPMHFDDHYRASLPPKIFEYMVCEIPVIASDFPEWRQVLEDSPYGQCGMCVDPEDPKAIAKAITYLIENQEEAMQMGLNGRKAVLDRYNWEKESQKLLQLYQRALPLSPSPAETNAL